MSNKSFNCLNCGRENPLHGANYANKYCNNKCQHEHRRRLMNKERIDNWLSGCGLFVWKEVPAYIEEHLIHERGHKCEVCGITEWCGKPAPLSVTQKDGDPYNNIPSNLELICPNCRAQK